MARERSAHKRKHLYRTSQRTRRFDRLARRNLGTSYADAHVFAVEWSITVQGWPSLHSSAVRTQIGSTPAVASLTLDLGNTFAFDFDPVKAKFMAVRATAARITQPAALGGASKALHVLIFPTGMPIPSPTPEACGKINCIDLRSVYDTPSSPTAPGRCPISMSPAQQAWSQSVRAAPCRSTATTFRMNCAKPARVRACWPSAIHAPAATNDFNANFSYDTFGAKVVVRKGRCVEGDAVDVDIIEGATYVSLPSIGSSGGAEARVGSSFKLCQSTLRQVHMEFKSPVGVPLGNSGLFLTGLEGTVDIFPGHTTISFGLDIQAAPGGDGGISRCTAG